MASFVTEKIFREIPDSVKDNVGQFGQTQKKVTVQSAGGGGEYFINMIRNVAGVAGIALFIIACVGCAGHLSPTVMGACAIGLTVPTLITSVLGAIKPPKEAENFKGCSRILSIISIIANAAIIALGVLAITGVLPAATVGLAILLPTLIAFAIGAVAGCCICCGVVALLGTMAATEITSAN